MSPCGDCEGPGAVTITSTVNEAYDVDIMELRIMRARVTTAYYADDQLGAATVLDHPSHLPTGQFS